MSKNKDNAYKGGSDDELLMEKRKVPFDFLLKCVGYVVGEERGKGSLMNCTKARRADQAVLVDPLA